MRDFVYNDPETLEGYQGWNEPGKLETGNVYLIEAVYWSKELTIKEFSKKGLNLSTGGTLPQCDASTSGAGSKKDTATPPTGQTAPGTNPSTSASTSHSTKPPARPATGAGAVAEKASKDALAAVAKDMAGDAAKAAAGNALVTISGGSCVGSNDVAHLKSEIPVPIGVTLDLVDYFKKGNGKLDYEGRVPRFEATEIAKHCS